jgi:hypothetical protein
LRGRHVGGTFNEQHSRSDEKTGTALAGTMTVAAAALATHEGTHFLFHFKSRTLKCAPVTVAASEENRSRA